MKSGTLKVVLMAIGMLVLATVAGRASAADAICYNCPPQWADWASQLKEIKKNLGLDILTNSQ